MTQRQTAGTQAHGMSATSKPDKDHERFTTRVGSWSSEGEDVDDAPSELEEIELRVKTEDWVLLLERHSNGLGCSRKGITTKSKIRIRFFFGMWLRYQLARCEMAVEDYLAHKEACVEYNELVNEGMFR
tara:strand:+ start:359 stop:745 length:387 start_codon:yes stop_codon:yes gene_type:complete